MYRFDNSKNKITKIATKSDSNELEAIDDNCDKSSDHAAENVEISKTELDDSDREIIDNDTNA